MFHMLDGQVTAKLCIPKIIIIFNKCDACKMTSDEVFLYIPVNKIHRFLQNFMPYKMIYYLPHKYIF